MKIKIIDYGYKNKPVRKHYSDAGLDVYLPNDIVVPKDGVVTVPLGFGLQLPDGFMAYFMPRSSFGKQGIIPISPPIDSKYTGEIRLMLTALEGSVKIEAGTRIAQLVIVPVVLADFVDDLGDERGVDSFGSTGKR